jgi:DNA-binding transcriptional regulator YiaG
MRSISIAEEAEESATEILKQDSMGRVRTPSVRREALLSEFERSGMSGAEFAAFVGIKYPTFANWVQKRRKQKQVSAALPEGSSDREREAMRWVEARIETAAAPSPGDDQALRVEFSMGVRMSVSDSRQAALAAEVLRHWEGGRRC